MPLPLLDGRSAGQKAAEPADVVVLDAIVVRDILFGISRISAVQANENGGTADVMERVVLDVVAIALRRGVRGFGAAGRSF